MNKASLPLSIHGLEKLEKRLTEGQATNSEVTHFLVTHFYAKVHRLALSIVQQQADADDIAQKTLLKAADKIHTYRCGSNFQSWVYKIAVNEARMALRREKARDRLVSILTLGAYSAVKPDQPEALLLRNERDRTLWKAVSQLPKKQKLPILLRYSFDCTDKEISDILNVAYGTVRSRLHHAHKKLHHLLRNEHSELTSANPRKRSENNDK